MPSELHWIVGHEHAAVRSGEGRVFRLWPRPGEPGRVPIGLHMALARPDDELYSDPSATRALIKRPIAVWPVRSPLAWLVVASLAVSAAVGLVWRLAAEPSAWLAGPAQQIATPFDLVAALLASVLGYAAAALWEAGLCTAQLKPGQACFGWGPKGPTVEPVVWRLGLPVGAAWQSLLAPALWSLTLLTCDLPVQIVATGFAAGSLLYLLRVCLPLRPGPATRILEQLLRVPDFSTGLRWGLTTQFLPANQRSRSGGPKSLVAGGVVFAVWVSTVCLAFALLAVSDRILPDRSASHAEAEEARSALAGTELAESSPPQSAKSEGAESRSAQAESAESIRSAKSAKSARSAKSTESAESATSVGLEFAGSQAALLLFIWRGLVAVAAFAALLWLVEAVARLFRYALLFGGRVERRPMSPSTATMGLWQRQSALMRHVPAMSKLPWQWSEASPGTLLVRQDESDRSFHWLASGEARVVSRDPTGNVRKLATVRGGSGVGEVALLEDQLRTADVVVSVTALVISLSFEDFDAGMEERDRERFREVVFAGRAFARSAVFEGCPGPDKERWIRGGRPRRYAVGEPIIRQGEAERWMGLVVDGSVQVEQDGACVAELESSSVFGEVAFLYETARNASLTAKTDVLLWSWDPEWLEEEVVRTGLRAELEELAANRARS